jgi:integrase/recombinase XerD
MLERLYVREHDRRRHHDASMLEERVGYLTHLRGQGFGDAYLRWTAISMLTVLRVLNMQSLRSIDEEEIADAGIRYLEDAASHRVNRAGHLTSDRFLMVAEGWFRFLGVLMEPPAAITPFHWLFGPYEEHLRTVQGLAPSTIRSYIERAMNFFKWLGERHERLDLISLQDIEEFLGEKRSEGWQPRTIATQCQGLRSLFAFVAGRGWCAQTLARGIKSPRIPKYEEAPKGPPWRQVRRMLTPVSNPDHADLRTRAALMLFAIYGLRVSEVAALRLDNFDWANEVLTLRRGKRGRIQQFPLLYEVGEAILQYLMWSRPQCACRNLFVTRFPPHRTVIPSVLNPLVRKRMKALGIVAAHSGPHSLRHACATQLLRKGTSLRNIADFLGHRDIRSVGIYAKYDLRSLRGVADFSLAGLK